MLKCVTRDQEKLKEDTSWTSIAFEKFSEVIAVTYPGSTYFLHGPRYRAIRGLNLRINYVTVKLAVFFSGTTVKLTVDVHTRHESKLRGIFIHTSIWGGTSYLYHHTSEWHVGSSPTCVIETSWWYRGKCTSGDGTGENIPKKLIWPEFILSKSLLSSSNPVNCKFCVSTKTLCLD
jgi:hypothetical protein